MRMPDSTILIKKRNSPKIGEFLFYHCVGIKAFAIRHPQIRRLFSFLHRSNPRQLFAFEIF